MALINNYEYTLIVISVSYVHFILIDRECSQNAKSNGFYYKYISNNGKYHQNKHKWTKKNKRIFILFRNDLL